MEKTKITHCVACGFISKGIRLSKMPAHTCVVNQVRVFNPKRKFMSRNERQYEE